MNFFAGKFDKRNIDYESNNFDTFLVSFITVFNIITLDSWTKTFDVIIGSQLFLAIFSVFWILIGNFLLLNLFITILLESFTIYLEEKEEKDSKFLDNEVEEIMDFKKDVLKKIDEGLVQSVIIKRQIAQENELNLPKIITLSNKKIIENTEVMLMKIKCEKSLFIFSKSNILRKIALIIKNNKLFKKTMNLVLFLSILELALETFDNDFNKWKRTAFFNFLFFLKFLNCLLFSIEALINIISLGFYFEKNTYLTDKWNILNLFLLISDYSQLFIILKNNENIHLGIYVKKNKLLN